MLSDSEYARGRVKNVKRRAAVTETNKYWSDSQKIEAVKTYLILGSMSLVAAALKIPKITLYSWKRTEWWKELELEQRQSENLVLTARLKTIVERSLGVVEDRLEKGDYVWDQKAQQLVRKPVSMKDAHKVATDSISQAIKLVTPEQHQIAEEGIKEKLEKLAKSFEAFANKQIEKAPVVVTDVVFQTETRFAEEQADAVHEDQSENGKERA